MKNKRIKLYENREDITLTTYVWTDSPDLLAGKKRPAVLICPGGGRAGAGAAQPPHGDGAGQRVDSF